MTTASTNISEIPRHIAIVMDGNGRWAEKRGRDRLYGHVRGSTKVKEVVEECLRLKVQALTLYAFSTENWERPESERQILWTLLKKYLKQYTLELKKQNIRLRFIGEMNRLSSDIQETLQTSLQALQNNTGLLLTFALSYGAHSEITQAAKQFATDCVQGKKKLEDLSESLFETYLDCSLPVDLFIRTSGEYRLSNFLLWQAAYAELVFMKVYWPDFSAQSLREAIQDYSQRQRRFGKLSPTPSRMSLSL